MILAPTLTLNTPARGFDADATAFAAISGATDVAALSAFVKGVKELGLWNSMVCWPLRGSQNAGTGTTAYSLGGLGTFNKSLINGPTWGTDGVSFDGTDDYASAGWPGITTEVTLMVVHKFVSAVAPNRVVQFSGADPGGLWSPFSDGNAYWDAINQSTARTSGTLGVSANTFFSHIGRANSSGLNQWRNGVTQISTSATPASFNYVPSNLEIGRNTTAVAYQGTVSFILIAQASNTSASVLHDLYKTTIGAGLGLP